MKKRTLIGKLTAMALACAVVFGNMGTMTVHATEGYDDGLYHGDGRDSIADGGGGDFGDSSSSDRGSSSSSGSSSSDRSGSSSSGSSESYGGGSSSDSGSSYDSGSGNSGSSSSGASYSVPAPKVAGTEVSAGKEKFRAAANAGAGTYKVTHKGIEIATFTLKGTDKKNVACTKVTLKLRDDKKYAINYEVADATGLTVGAPLDRTYMYNTLGVSYVTINDEVVIDIEAEAQAAAAK